MSGREDERAAARKRAAVEIVARHERVLRRTARRYSLCAEDAEDAYQRALEILLTKAPTTDLRELIRWTQTVTKHEALAVRRAREQLLGRTPARGRGDGETVDWVALVPAEGDGPAERAVRKEAVARSREALKALKPAELRALSLLAEGYSYVEIGEITGFSRTKVNRCLAEGRERFRSFLARSEEGERCAELRPLLSAFCDGEATPADAALLREHLRACGPCRSAVRAYRATPGAVAALFPTLPGTASLLDSLREAVTALRERATGGEVVDSSTHIGSAESTKGVEAVGTKGAGVLGGAKGGGVAALTKVVAVCAGAAVGVGACVATGLLPVPLDGAGGDAERTAIGRPAVRTASLVGRRAAPQTARAKKQAARRRKRPERQRHSATASTVAAEPVPTEYGPTSAPPPAPAPTPEPAEPTPAPEAAPLPAAPEEAAGSAPEGGGAAGEFGP